MIEQPALLILLMKDNELPHSLQLNFLIELSSPRFTVSPSRCVDRRKENVKIHQNKIDAIATTFIIRFLHKRIIFRLGQLNQKKSL
jgi:hypothetical protein